MLKWSAINVWQYRHGGDVDTLVSERVGNAERDGHSVNYNIFPVKGADGFYWGIASVFILTEDGKIAMREVSHLANSLVHAFRIVEAYHKCESWKRLSLNDPEATWVTPY